MSSRLDGTVRLSRDVVLTVDDEQRGGVGVYVKKKSDVRENQRFIQQDWPLYYDGTHDGSGLRELHQPTTGTSAFSTGAELRGHRARFAALH